MGSHLSTLARKLVLPVKVTIILIYFSGCGSSDIVSNRSPAGSSEKVRKSPQLEQLTRELLDANALLKANPDNETRLAQLKDKAQKRMRALLDSVEKDPSSVLDVAFSKKVRDSFPDAAKEYLEEELHQIRGTLGVLCALQEDGSHQDHYLLSEKDGKRSSLHLRQDTHHQGHQSGTNVEIPSAFRLPDSGGINHLIAADMSGTGNGTSEMIEAFVPPNRTTGVFKTLMILANFRDQVQPWTLDGIKSLGQTVNDFNYENSFRHTTLPTTVVGPFTIPADSTTTKCDLGTITSKINPLLSAAGIDTSGYDRRVYITPKLSTCGGTVGWGYIGVDKTWGITWVGAANLQVTAHELGHNFGLQHSGSRTCGATTLGSSCTSSAYADVMDTMGNRRAGHFNAAQKEALGWLNEPGFPSITSVQSTGTYTIEPYESFSMNSKAIRLAKSPDALGSKYYYLEYRQPIGFDNIGFPGNLYQGLTLHQGSGDVSSNYTYLLNMAPTDTSWNNAAISGTNVFNDPAAPGGGVSISLNSASSAGASVSIKFGNAPPPTCTRANPTLTVSPNTIQWVSPGGSANYTLSLKNNDSSACSSASFNLAATAASGTSAVLSSSSLTVNAGSTGTINIQLKASTSAPNGPYPANVTAVHNSSSNSATATLSLGVQTSCVRASPVITLSPASQTGVAGGNVTYTLNLKNNDSNECPVAAFNLDSTIPSGVSGRLSQNSISLSPGSSGAASLTANSSLSTTPQPYKLEVRASHSSNTQLMSSASAVYVVLSACMRSNPSITLTPANQIGTIGGTATYALIIKNNDSSPCPSSSFSLSSSIPTGLTGSTSANTLSLSPGGIGTVNLTVRSSLSTQAGTYTVSASVTHSTATSLTATASGTYVLVMPPVAKMSVSPITGKGTLLTHFDGSSSNNPGGGSLTYTWDFGDDSPKVSGGMIVDHLYQGYGNYRPKLTVTDQYGGTSSVSGVTVSVSDGTPPTAPQTLKSTLVQIH